MSGLSSLKKKVKTDFEGGLSWNKREDLRESLKDNVKETTRVLEMD